MKIFRSLQPLQLIEVVPSLQSGEVSTCWRGQSIEPGTFRWSFVVAGEELWFSAEVLCGRPHFIAQHEQGACVEGLWEHDVAEFFLKDATGRYQEFNFSPAGAYWSCLFSGYRQRADASAAVRPVSIAVRVDDAGWGVRCGISIRQLAVSFDPSTTVHVSAIATVGGARRFLSSAAVTDSEPDFHHPDTFQPIELVG